MVLLLLYETKKEECKTLRAKKKGMKTEQLSSEKLKETDKIGCEEAHRFSRF